MADKPTGEKPVPTQEGRNRPRPPGRASLASPSRVMVKFRSDVQLAYEDGAERYLEEYKIGPWRKLVEEFPGINLKRLFTNVKPERITHLVELARSRDQPTSRRISWPIL